MILLMSLWFFGWVGMVFLTVRGVILEKALDGMLAERVAQVVEERRELRRDADHDS